MKTLELNRMGLEPLGDSDLLMTVGGGFWTELLKAIGIEAALTFLKKVGQAAIDDWNSRPGTHLNMTDSYIANPYH